MADKMSAMEKIEFWFDFSSGYAYFSALEIEAIGERVGRSILWRPYLPATTFKVTCAGCLASNLLKKDYAQRDLQRIARRLGVGFELPPHHPSIALAATEAFYAIEERNPKIARTFALEVLNAYFMCGIDTGKFEHIASVAALFGVDVAALSREVARPHIKEKIKIISERAIAAGVFGSPFFIVDGEPFWGFDRMQMMEMWIEKGGW